MGKQCILNLIRIKKSIENFKSLRKKNIKKNKRY